MLSIFYSFWYGKVTLWKAYWLVGELLNILMMLVIFNIEIYIFISLAFLTLFFGIYPEPLFNTIDISVNNIINEYQIDLNLHLAKTAN